jgi:hypothetical protein
MGLWVFLSVGNYANNTTSKKQIQLVIVPVRLTAHEDTDGKQQILCQHSAFDRRVVNLADHSVRDGVEQLIGKLFAFLPFMWLSDNAYMISLFPSLNFAVYFVCCDFVDHKPKRMTVASECRSSCEVIVLMSPRLAGAERASASASTDGCLQTGDDSVTRSAAVDSWDLKLNQDHTQPGRENIARVRFKTPVDGSRVQKQLLTEDSERGRREIFKAYQAEVLTNGHSGSNKEPPTASALANQSVVRGAIKSSLWGAMNSNLW